VSAIVSIEGRPTGLARVLSYRDLLLTLTRRELRAKYKGSLLGIAWSYLHPLLMMSVYVLVFSVLWRAVDIPNYPVFVLAGLAAWSIFQAGVYVGMISVLANGDLIKKIWFPREALVISTVLAQAVAGLVTFVVVAPVGLVFANGTLPIALLAVPFLLVLTALTVGLALLLATANVFFRDVEHFIGVLFLPWFFLTPVFYSLESLPGAASHPILIDLLRYGNPVTPYVEALRGVLVHGVVPGPATLVYVFVAGPALLLIGMKVLQRYEDRFALAL
jgi:lipopolysaccharide transport system permease protein